MSQQHGMVGDFTPEFRLACLCCRSTLDSGCLDEIALLLGRVDVAAFVELVLERHRIGPLVYAAMKQLPLAALPKGLMEPLAAAARDNAIKALHAQRALILLARWFAEAGIDWMPFKGLTLARRYYGDIAQRHVNDLDIWVPGSSLAQARALLGQHGFRLDGSDSHWKLADRGPRHRDYLTRYYHEERHLSSEFGLLELHWRLTDTPSRFSLSPQQMLDQAEDVEWGGLPVRVMNDTDLLLYLCEHGGRHGWCRLKWLADIPRLLAHRQWEWSQVMERARNLGCERTLLLAFALCEQLMGWIPPDIVRARLAKARALSLLCDIVQQTLQVPIGFHEANAKVSLTWLVRDALRALLLSASVGAFATQVWRRSLSPPDLQVLRLPDRWFGAYYLLRPILFAVRRLQG